MDKMEKFKKFAASKPHLKRKVDNKEITWQELYEKYDIYGEDDPIFKDETNNEKTKSRQEGNFSSFVDMLNNIDIDKISEGLNGMKKILSILSEITQKDEINSKRKENQPFDRKID